MLYRNKYTQAIIEISAFFLLFCSIFYEWFSVYSTNFIKIETFSLSYIYKIIVLLFLLLFFKFRKVQNLTFNLKLILLFLLLTYPYLILTYGGEQGFRAIKLDAQVQNLLWLGGSVSTSHEARKDGSLNSVRLTNINFKLNPLSLPILHPYDLNFNHLPKVLNFLGFNSTFCMFVKKGWFLSIFGIVLLLTGQFSVSKREFRIFNTTLILPFLFLLIVFLSIFFASLNIQFSKKEVAKFEYENALKYLETSGRIIPIIRNDSSYVLQKLMLESFTARNLALVKTWESISLLRQNIKSASYQDLLHILQNDKVSIEYKYLIKNIILQKAIDLFNSNQMELSGLMLNSLSRVFEGDLDIMFYLSWYSYRNGDLKLFEIQKLKIKKLLSNLSHQNKKIIISSVQDLHSRFYFEKNNIEKGNLFRQKSYQGKW